MFEALQNPNINFSASPTKYPKFRGSAEVGLFSQVFFKPSLWDQALPTHQHQEKLKFLVMTFLILKYVLNVMLVLALRQLSITMLKRRSYLKYFNELLDILLLFIIKHQIFITAFMTNIIIFINDIQKLANISMGISERQLNMTLKSLFFLNIHFFTLAQT